MKIKKGKKPIRYLANVPKFGVESARNTQSTPAYTTTAKTSIRSDEYFGFLKFFTDDNSRIRIIRFSIAYNILIALPPSKRNGRISPDTNAHGEFKIILSQVA